MRILRRVLCVAALLAAPCRAADLILVEGGQPASVIVTSDKPLAWQQLAAEEIQSHLQKISGAQVPIVRSTGYAPQPGRAAILVGQSPQLAALGVDTKTFEPEQFLIKTTPSALILAGDDSCDSDKPERLKFSDVVVRTGTLYAVYDFLQGQLGCRWVWPGETGQVIIPRSTITVSPLDVKKTPMLIQRCLRPVLDPRQKDDYTKALSQYFDIPAIFDTLSRDEALWLKRMRMGRASYIAMGHSFTKWWEQYGKDTPEIFALQPNGKRGPTGTPETVKMCVASPKLHEMQIEAYKKGFAQSPWQFAALKCCENDGNSGYCHCPLCRAWDWTPTEADVQRLAPLGWDVERLKTMTAMDKDGLPQRLSHRYARWWNTMALLARQVNPRALVTCYAYNRYSTPPIGMKLEPNILVAYVAGDTYPKTAEAIAAGRNAFRQWGLTGASFFVRPNSLYFTGHAVPFIFTRQICDDFKFYVANGVRGTDHDSLLGYWATTGPTYYVLARLHWDTELTVDEILDKEYYPAFGPMAAVVKEYFDFWERFTTEKWTDPKLPERLKALSPTSTTRARVMVCGELYSAGDFAKGRAILEKAVPLLPKATQAERARFENIRLGLRHAELTAQSLASARDIQTANPPSGAYDIRQAAATVQELLRLRRQIALRNVTNVLCATNTERRLYYWVNRIHMAADLGDRVGVSLIRDNRWRIRLDPDNAGLKDGWVEKAFAASASKDEWTNTNVRQGKNWGDGPAGEGWRKQHGKEYAGPAAWYRVDVTPPAFTPGARPGILLCGARGGVQAWLNGKALGESPAPAGELAGRSVEFALPPGAGQHKTWRLLVRVESDQP
ncbi:MAG TPA: DUF4838 domain-containing protein, partial [Candidatus Brocadiia bacterium]|nr:DUF4838 domain-containing protein [Candidatus Brocadiia bacterium]